MRVAMVAPLAEAVPPPLYGGTERVVYNLTEEMVRRGHEVTLFASGDSSTSADLAPVTPRALRLDPDAPPYLAATLAQLSEVYRRASDFDLIHSHVDWPTFAFARLCPTPTITTIHGRLDLREFIRTFRLYPEQPLVSISYSQRVPLADANWVGTAYNGIDVSRFHFRPTGGDYLVFLGRIAPEKRPDRAIEVARRVDRRLIIAAKVDPADHDYYEARIAPLIRDNPLVEYIGEVNEAEKDTLLGGAYAYLFPIDWPEPFGLTMVEAMATGTPVVAWRGGSVDEIVRHEETGFICDSIDEMVHAVEAAGEIDRAACRSAVESRFSAKCMASRYEDVYAKLLETRAPTSMDARGEVLSLLERLSAGGPRLG